MTSCHDCPHLDAARMAQVQPGWTPRASCCCDVTAERMALDQRARDDNAARQMAALREHCPPGTPLNNRKQRRRALAKFGRKAGL